LSIALHLVLEANLGSKIEFAIAKLCIAVAHARRFLPCRLLTVALGHACPLLVLTSFTIEREYTVLLSSLAVSPASGRPTNRDQIVACAHALPLIIVALFPIQIENTALFKLHTCIPAFILKPR
jgi:uncharacterized membrane protein YjjB (DUF3815 family)